MRPADTVLPILFYLSIFFLIRKVLIFIFHAYTRTNVTIRGSGAAHSNDSGRYSEFCFAKIAPHT